MSLRDTLDCIARSVDGTLAALIMACDGIPIAEITVRHSELDLQLLSVESATLLKEVRQAVNVIRIGDLEEIVITTSQTSILVRALHDDIFAALVLKRDGNIGKGRYMLRLKSFEILEELA